MLQYELIHQQALKAAENFKRAESDLLDIIQKVEDHKVFRQFGKASLFEYATVILGLSESVAYTFINVGRKAREVPALKEEITAGRLSLSKARKIVPVITLETQAEWIAKAETLTSRALEKEVAKASPATATPERAKYVSENRMILSLGVSESLMEDLRHAQDILSHREQRPVTLEETLSAVTQLFLEKNDPVRKAEAKAPGQALAAPARKQAVTGQVKRVPMPAVIKRGVDLRDRRQCAHVDEKGKRCSHRRHLDYHHRLPVELGGDHSVENILTLCSAHHRMWHAGLTKSSWQN